MQTTVTELPDSRAEVEVEVPAERRRDAASARRPRAGPGDAAARLPQGQGAALAGDPAARLRRRARGGDPRVAARVVRTGAARLRDQPDRRSRASRSSRPRRTRASRSSFKFEIGVRPDGQARRLQGPRGRQGRDRGRPRRSSTARSSGSARASPGSSRSSAPAAEGDVAADRLRGPDRRQGLRGRQGRATTCWSSAAAS